MHFHKALLGFVCLCFLDNTCAIWWWFSSDSSSSNKQEHTQDGEPTSSAELSQVFAPFEITNMEEKFLSEAKNYLQNLPMLDQCNMLIINRLKTSCNQLSDEQMSRLSVNLLNCQSAVEGRKTYRCTDEMELSECTGPMDPDTWNSYHIISNRARAICYNFRQAQFRMKTEQTVNKLASSTADNINRLKGLADGQQKLQEATDEAMLSVSQNQKELLSNQNNLQKKQAQIDSALNDNINDILKEKRLISLRHKQVESYTQMINEQLTSLVDEIKTQDRAKKESEKEILKDLDSVKEKADEVLQKLGDAFEDMDTFHDSLEGKQNKTLKNLEEIQDTVAFMNQVLQKMYTSFHEQLPWLHDLVGGTLDKFAVASCIIGHAGFFMASFFAVIFVNAPSVTRALMLFIVPLNCLAMLNSFDHHLTYLQMAWILAGSVPIFYLVRTIYRGILHLRYGSKQSLVQTKQQTPTKFNFDSPPLINRTLVHSDLLRTDLTPIGSCHKKRRLRDEEDEMQRMSPARNLTFPEFCASANNSPSSPRTWSVKDHLNASSSRLNTTLGGSIKCNAKTKSGLRCRNSAIGCGDTCRVHTPKKD